MSGAITLQTLRRFADQLDCDLAYFLVPRTTLLDSVERRAERVARAESELTAHSLGMAWQVVPPPAFVEIVESLKQELVATRPARLWDPIDGE